MRQFLGTLLLVVATTPAAAQTTQTPAAPAAPAPSTSTDTRKATTTFLGDTGLWNVPTGEVLPARRWSFSGYRVNFDDNQGFSDVSNWPLTFAFGVRDRVEIFGSLVLVNRIDRDVRPLFLASVSSVAPDINRRVGGFVPQNPFALSGWSGNQIGDLWVGAKWNLMSQWRQQSAAFALRTAVKIPTGDDDGGGGTGGTDFAIDAVLSREMNERVELSGYAGFIARTAGDAADAPSGLRWGFGAGFPARKSLRVTAEIDGEIYTDDTLKTKVQFLGADGSFAPAGFEYIVQSPLNVNLGLTWQHRNGFFAGAAWTWQPKIDPRDQFFSASTNGAGDRMDIVGRIGYHPGVRIYVPPPQSTPPAPPPAAAQNRPPTVRVRCEPCTVYLGRISTLSAEAQDPDGDPLTYTWGAPAGALTSATARQTPWTAPMQEGPVPVTVTVRDNRGASASDVVTIQVIREAVKEVVFEDVHFDFDRYSLRPEATRALDEAVQSLQQNPNLRITIEGHTCNIGTPEYNLALGARRASAVQAYLTSRGIAPDRLQTVSYGEERPKFDNGREETRRLNRRAALLVRVQ